MSILSCVRQEESHFKIAVCRYYDVLINGKVISKLRYVYIIMRSSKGKSFQNCGMYISQCVCQWESHLKVAEYSSVEEVTSKLRNAYITNFHEWEETIKCCSVYIP